MSNVLNDAVGLRERKIFGFTREAMTNNFRYPNRIETASGLCTSYLYMQTVCDVIGGRVARWNGMINVLYDAASLRERKLYVFTRKLITSNFRYLTRVETAKIAIGDSVSRWNGIIIVLNDADSICERELFVLTRKTMINCGRYLSRIDAATRYAAATYRD